MTIPSTDTPGVKRPFAVVPARAARDRRLKASHLRVLMALGYYANRAGVCWPSFVAIGKESGIDPSDAAKLCKDLVKFGMIRKLQPNSYNQAKGAWGYSNRYQVLWQGDEPIPAHEDVLSANLLQPIADRIPIEGLGYKGPQAERTLAGAMVSAFLTTIEAETGYRPAAGPPLEACLPLIDAGVTVDQVRRGTSAASKANLAARRGPPSFYEARAQALAIASAG